MPDTVLSKYLRQVGAEKLKLRKRTHEPQPSDTAGPSPAPPLLQAQVEPVADLEQCSDPADLASVACSTHKESSTAQRQLAKSAGMLCVCLSEGLILHTQEHLWLRVSEPALLLRRCCQSFAADPDDSGAR